MIGINTAIVAQGQGIGFAIPIAMANNILPDLKAKGKVTRGWMGVTVQDITEDMARSLQLKDRRGAIITEVFKGDPADLAGLRPGDIVTAINGKKIKDTHELLLLISSFHVGDKVGIAVLRDGRAMNFQVTVAERRDRPETAQSSRGGYEHYGLAVGDITPEIARYLGIPKKTGVIVMRVQPGSPADEVGIQPQDVVLQVNKVKISSVKDYLREVNKKAASGSVMLLIKRGQATFFVALRK